MKNSMTTICVLTLIFTLSAVSTFANISGSTLTAVSKYTPGEANTLVFRCDAVTPDFEYMYTVVINYPAGMNVTAGETATGEINGGTFSYNDAVGAAAIARWDSDENLGTGYGSLVNGESAYFTNEVIVDASLSGDLILNYELIGDGYGSTPHNLTGSVTLEESCVYGIAPTSNSIDATGGSASVAVTSEDGCNWTATSNAGWITVTAGSSGSGNGTVSYSVAENIDITSPRTGTITIAGETFTVNQEAAACVYGIAPTSNSIDATGGSASVAVTSEDGCNWTAFSNESWIFLTGATSGDGVGIVDYSVDENTSVVARSGTISVAGMTFIIDQAECPEAQLFFDALEDWSLLLDVCDLIPLSMCSATQSLEFRFGKQQEPLPIDEMGRTWEFLADSDGEYQFISAELFLASTGGYFELELKNNGEVIAYWDMVLSYQECELYIFEIESELMIYHGDEITVDIKGKTGTIISGSNLIQFTGE